MKRLFLLTMAFAIVIAGCKKDKQPGEETPAAVPVEEISLSAPEGVICMGADVQLTATVLPEDASEKSLKWSSSDETIAEVNSSGLVSFFNHGTVTITAKAKDDSDVSASINLAAQPWRLVFVKNYPNDFPKNSTEEISTNFSSYILKEDDVLSQEINWE